MEMLRVAWRLPSVIIITLASFLILVCSFPLRPVAPAWQLAIRNRIFRLWSRGFARIVGMRIRVEGKPPTGRFFLVSNHQSYMDIMLLGSQIHAAFVAKADLRSWPALGTIFASADTIFVDRGRKKDLLRVLDLIRQALDRDMGVLLFPEGTSGKGDQILPFKPSLLQFPVAESYPVHYAVLTYHSDRKDAPAQEHICWWGDAPFASHFLGLLRLPGFEGVIRFGGEPIAHEDRKGLAKELHAAMDREFLPSN